MSSASVRVSAALRDRVAGIDLLDADGEVVEVLPSTGAVLGLQLSGRVRSGDGLLATAGITGIQTATRRYEYVGPTRSLLVRFTPAGASCLGVPASELAGRSVALADVLRPAMVRELSERLDDAAAAGEIGRIGEIVEALLEGLAWVPDPVIERALAWLDPSDPPPRSVAEVAGALDISERQLERRFLARVGLSPKRYASLRRFERAVTLARTGEPLTEVAITAGYYDQSHCIREFRRFAGVTPSELRSRA